MWDAYETACSLWMHAVAVLKGVLSDADLAKRLGSLSKEVHATATHRITPDYTVPLFKCDIISGIETSG